ncbi:MAG: Asp-tRNA(Asn)/Glu-tRNA(Gln) amidotransferase subunit GatA [bacterium]|nr:Asp-tRNA(Asn)/Glu-tRNA(Gln) amidotransferase subunit GatA [bacterium]
MKKSSMILELRKKLDQKKVSAVELTQDYLATIKKKNSELNSFISVEEEFALKQAKHADMMIADGDANILTGIPYTLKDLFCVKGVETTAGSNILKGYIPPYTATAVERLNGAVMLGKTNTDEFAMGASTETSCFGPTKNPYDLSRVAGGSSGGPVAAVATDMAVFALGTDTGGSIRQPAAFSGVAGLRVTYGRVSRYGAIAMASSLDTVGPIAKTVEDLAIILEQIAGIDVLDGTTLDKPVEEYTKALGKLKKNITIGIPKEYFELEGLDIGVQQKVENVIAELKKQGIKFKEISLPHTKYAVPAYYIITPSEVSSNMARYDGIKFGYRAENASELMEVYKQSRSAGFGDEVKRRIMLGTYALSAGYYDAYYLKAMKVRTLIRNDFTTAFKDVDLIITPTTPTTAFKIGENMDDPIKMYLADIYTAPASLAGIPGLAIPCGEVDNLPVSVQILGPQWSESSVLQLGKVIEEL